MAGLETIDHRRRSTGGNVSLRTLRKLLMEKAPSPGFGELLACFWGCFYLLLPVPFLAECRTHHALKMPGQ
jgi:hypothetical protein